MFISEQVCKSISTGNFLWSQRQQMQTTRRTRGGIEAGLEMQGHAVSSVATISIKEWSWLTVWKQRFQPNSYKEVNPSHNQRRGPWTSNESSPSPGETQNRIPYSNLLIHQKHEVKSCYLVIMCVCVVYMHVTQAVEYTMSRPMREETRRGCVFLSLPNLRQNVSAIYKPTISARLTGQGSPGICLFLSLPPLCWHHRHAQLVGDRDMNFGSHACTASALTTEPALQPPSHC